MSLSTREKHCCPPALGKADYTRAHLPLRSAGSESWVCSEDPGKAEREQARQVVEGEEQQGQRPGT